MSIILKLEPITKHPIYKSWSHCKQRCYNTKSQDYKFYGAKGIKMAPEWISDSRAFYNWSLENGWAPGKKCARKDLNGDFTPDNCYWADSISQVNQAKDFNFRFNAIVELFGESKTVREWLEDARIKISKKTFINRCNEDWDYTRALTEEYKSYSKHNQDLENKYKVGDKFNRLTIIDQPKIVEHYGIGANKAHFQCECGTIKYLKVTSVVNGTLKSCGCLKAEKARERMIKANLYREDLHGQTQTRLYRIWAGLKSRTTNKKSKRSKDYIDRGIKVCKEWKDFNKFYKWATQNGYQDNLTIDRINNDGNYCPENCRWTTNKEQQRNKRSNVKITAWDETKVLAEWVEDERCLCENTSAIRYRIKVGWTPEQAISTALMIKDRYHGKNFETKPKKKNLNYKSYGERKHHNLTGHPLHKIWMSLRSRCNNPNNIRYYRYGERGIVVCPEWNTDFENFYNWANSNGWQEGLSLDRINNDGNYEPSNCRFVSKIEQANNTSKNKFVTIFGETKTLAQWGRDNRCKVSYNLLRVRLQNNINQELALTKEKGKLKN